MLIALFRRNEVAAFVLLPIVCGLLYFSWFLSPQNAIDTSGFLLYDGYFELTANYPILGGITAVFLVLLEAILLVNFFNKNEFTEKNTALPGLVYVILAAGFIAVKGLSPLLFANLFILLALRRIMQAYGEHVAYGAAFEVGLLLGIAALFYPPVVFLLVFIWIALGILRTFNWREWMLPLVGFTVPCMFAVAWLLHYPDPLIMNRLFLWEPDSAFFFVSENIAVEWSAIVILALLSLVSIYHIAQGILHSAMRGKKSKQTLVVFSLFMLGIYIFSLSRDGDNFRLLNLALPLSLLFSLYFARSKRTFLANLLLYALLGVCALEIVLEL